MGSFKHPMYRIFIYSDLQIFVNNSRRRPFLTVNHQKEAADYSANVTWYMTRFHVRYIARIHKWLLVHLTGTTDNIFFEINISFNYKNLTLKLIYTFSFLKSNFICGIYLKWFLQSGPHLAVQLHKCLR